MIHADSQAGLNKGSFSVTAYGEIVAKPDIGNFTFTVISEGGDNLGELQAENNQTTESITNFLVESGVEKDDIETQDYNVQPRRQYYGCEAEVCPPPEIVGYSIYHTVDVKVRNLDIAGELLGGAVERGADSVSNLSFTIDNPEELEAQAQGEAIAKAKEKAQMIAKAGGFRVGKILYINVLNETPITPYRAMEAMSSDGLGGGPVPVEPGSEEVRMGVSVTYEIK